MIRQTRPKLAAGMPLTPMADRDLPTGTVTFLLTDLEGRTRPLEAHPAADR